MGLGRIWVTALITCDFWCTLIELWCDHRLVDNPLSLSLLDLQDRSRFRTITLPVTLVCAGNRRKEQNSVSKSLGFSWGAAGVSTALFTGVYLADLLAAAKPIRRRAKHIIFEGIDKLPNGPYGTSQRLSWAADRSKGMLIGPSLRECVP